MDPATGQWSRDGSFVARPRVGARPGHRSEGCRVSQSLPVPTLVGQCVRLEPLQQGHVADLVVAANEDRATYSYTAVPADVAGMSRMVSDLREDFETGLVVPFAQVDVASERAVGVTRFMTMRALEGCAVPYAVEIGGTWLAASAQRTRTNTEAKFLLLRYAFDTWSVARVDLKTDHSNDRSRAAISRIGATFEGVLRHWQPSVVLGEEGHYRDTAMFSVIDEEWPRVAAHLRSLLA